MIWRDSAPFCDAAGIRAAATHLLKSAPRGLRRPRVVALFGPRWVQLKRVLGLPAATPARVATDVIREHCPAFFLHKSALLIAEARRASDDAVWCAAFESSAVNAVIGALDAHRLRLRAAVPTVAALARERTGAWNFADGPDVLAVVSENGQLVSVRRALAPVENSTHDYEDTRAAARAWRARQPRVAAATAMTADVTARDLRTLILGAIAIIGLLVVSRGAPIVRRWGAVEHGRAAAADTERVAAARANAPQLPQLRDSLRVLRATTRGAGFQRNRRVDLLGEAVAMMASPSYC